MDRIETKERRFAGAAFDTNKNRVNYVPRGEMQSIENILGWITGAQQEFAKEVKTENQIDHNKKILF